MRSSSSDLRVVELSGSAQAVGESFGEEFREDIRAFTESRLAHVVEFVGRHAPARCFGRRDALACAARTAPAHRDYDALIWEEFCGIARGAELSVEELLVGNGLTDMRDFALFCAPWVDHAPPGDTGECSALLVPSACAGETGPVVAQTWDMNAEALDYMVVVHRKISGISETICLTTVGCLCLIGLNSEGVAVGNTNLVPTDSRPGVNYLFTITRALRAGTAEEAARLVEATPRLSGHDFYVADAGTVINVETSARRSVRTQVADAAFVHTNHYLDPELSAVEFAGQALAGSRWRHERLTALLAEERGPLGVDGCWRLLSDAARGAGDAAVCRENDGTRGGVCTVATVVQRPGAGRFEVCAGGGRTGTRETFRL